MKHLPEEWETESEIWRGRPTRPKDSRLSPPRCITTGVLLFCITLAVFDQEMHVLKRDLITTRPKAERRDILVALLLSVRDVAAQGAGPQKGASLSPSTSGVFEPSMVSEKAVARPERPRRETSPESGSSRHLSSR